jgi:hypothetical protein
MTDYDMSTESRTTRAQEKIIGKFCTRCRRHKDPAGGETIKAGSNVTRWVCAPCAKIGREHKRWAQK